MSWPRRRSSQALIPLARPITSTRPRPTSCRQEVAFKGGRATQAGMQIGASTLADPGIGLAHFTLPDDAIDSVAVLPNPYEVEYGRFSSGLVVIQTRRAGEQWKVRLNNLDPTFRTRRHQELYTIK